MIKTIAKERAHNSAIFKTQSELVEPVLPQAEQLGMNFYCFYNTVIDVPA